MKKLNAVCSYLLLIVFLMVSGNTGFAATETLLQKTSSDSEIYKVLQNSKALIFHEVSEAEVSQIFSENELGSAFFLFSEIATELSIIERSYTSANRYQFLDKRKLMSQYIFPFHFFW